MTKKRNIWVTPHEEGWAVKREGAKKSTRVTQTKAEATKIAKVIAKNNEVELIVQRKDGVIQSKDSFGNDSDPPKDTEH